MKREAIIGKNTIENGKLKCKIIKWQIIRKIDKKLGFQLSSLLVEEIMLFYKSTFFDHSSFLFKSK
jgi:hypothetical protein